MSSVGLSGDDEMDMSIQQQTLDEVGRKWPLAAREVPVTAPISRRFEVKQKDKFRPVGDFSKSAVN